ncbi:hypothetical protein, partial [Burkholderia sp. HAN2018]
PAPQALDFGPAPDRPVRTAPAEAVGRAVFAESNHPQLEACFRAAQASFPNLYPDYAPRIERHIRQLVPLKLTTVATIGDGALETAGNLVEAVAATTREFNELGAADMMAGMLAQATRKAGMFERWFGGAAGHVDYRAALGALKQSLGFFPRRTEELAAKVRHAEENLVVVLAALSAVSDVVRAPDDAGIERTLFDRRNIVGQAVQQIRMQPAQLRGLDERVTDLLSRADHLMNVVLPAALAARPQR